MNQSINGNSLCGDVKYTRWKNLRISTEITVYLGNGTRWITNRNSLTADWSVSVPTILSDLDRPDAADPFLRTPIGFDLLRPNAAR